MLPFVLYVFFFSLQMSPKKRLICRRNPFRIFEYLQLSLEEVCSQHVVFSAVGLWAWASHVGESTSKCSSACSSACSSVLRSPQAESTCSEMPAFHSSAFISSILRCPFRAGLPRIIPQGFQGGCLSTSFHIKVSDCPDIVLLIFSSF